MTPSNAPSPSRRIAWPPPDSSHPRRGKVIRHGPGRLLPTRRRSRRTVAPGAGRGSAPPSVSARAGPAPRRTSRPGRRRARTVSTTPRRSGARPRWRARRARRPRDLLLRAAPQGDPARSGKGVLAGSLGVEIRCRRPEQAERAPALVEVPDTCRHDATRLDDTTHVAKACDRIGHEVHDQLGERSVERVVR